MNCGFSKGANFLKLAPHPAFQLFLRKCNRRKFLHFFAIAVAKRGRDRENHQLCSQDRQGTNLETGLYCDLSKLGRLEGKKVFLIIRGVGIK